MKEKEDILYEYGVFPGARLDEAFKRMLVEHVNLLKRVDDLEKIAGSQVNGFVELTKRVKALEDK